MNAFLAFLAERKKAAIGFATPGVSAFAVIWAQNQTLPTGHQWEVIGVTCVLTAFGVHKITNAAPSTDGPEGI